LDYLLFGVVSLGGKAMVANIITSIVSRIRLLTVLGVLLGGMYAGTEGAIIGGILGFLLDQKFGV